MTAAAACDHDDLAHGAVGDLGTHEDRLVRQSSQAGKDSDQSIDHHFDDGFEMVKLCKVGGPDGGRRASSTRG